MFKGEIETNIAITKKHLTLRRDYFAVLWWSVICKGGSIQKGEKKYIYGLEMLYAENQGDG